jgi:hypothetical protein
VQDRLPPATEASLGDGVLGNSPTVRAFLREHRPFDSVNLLGGDRAISNAVETQIRAELQ